MKRKTWQYTRFKFLSEIKDFLDAWDPFIGGPNLKIVMNDDCAVIFYKYHRGLSCGDRPTKQELEEAVYT